MFLKIRLWISVWAVIIAGILLTSPSYAQSIRMLHADYNQMSGVATISGNVETEGTEVTIRLLDPGDRLAYIGQTTSGPEGRFEFRFTIENVATGIYGLDFGGVSEEPTTIPFPIVSSSGGKGSYSSGGSYRVVDYSVPHWSDVSYSQENIRQFLSHLSAWTGKISEQLAVTSDPDSFRQQLHELNEIVAVYIALLHKLVPSWEDVNQVERLVAQLSSALSLAQHQEKSTREKMVLERHMLHLVETIMERMVTIDLPLTTREGGSSQLAEIPNNLMDLFPHHPRESIYERLRLLDASFVAMKAGLDNANAAGTITRKMVLGWPTNEIDDRLQLTVPVHVLKEISRFGFDALELRAGSFALTIPTGVVLDEISYLYIDVNQRTLPDGTEWKVYWNGLDNQAKETVIQLQEAIKIRVPHPKKRSQTAHRFSLHQQERSFSKIPFHYDEATRAITFHAEQPDTWAVKLLPETPSGQTTIHWAMNDVYFLQNKGIISGDYAAIMSLDATLDEQQLLAMLNRTISLALANPQRKLAASWLNDTELSSVSQLPNTSGEGLMREEMAKMITSLFKDQSPEQIDLFAYFTDWNEISAEAKMAVANAVKYELLQGKPDNVFAPHHVVTRAEAAVVAVRLYEMLAQ